MFNEICINIYIIKYMGFGFVGLCGISIIVDYLMPNHLYRYILKKKDLVGLAFMSYQPL